MHVLSLAKNSVSLFSNDDIHTTTVIQNIFVLLTHILCIYFTPFYSHEPILYVQSLTNLDICHGHTNNNSQTRVITQLTTQECNATSRREEVYEER